MLCNTVVVVIRDPSHGDVNRNGNTPYPLPSGGEEGYLKGLCVVLSFLSRVAIDSRYRDARINVAE